MSGEPENLVLELLRGIRAEVASVRAEMATKTELAEVRAEVHSLRADVAADLLDMQARMDAQFKFTCDQFASTRDQIVGLRRTVTEYHSAVVGHGVLISELETRMRRVEQHLGLPFLD